MQLQLKRKGVLDNLRRLEAEGKLKRTQERKERTEKSMEEIERRMKKIQELRSKASSIYPFLFHPTELESVRK